MAFDDRPSDFYREENLASYSRESFTTVANSNAGGAIGLKLRPVLQAQISSGRGCTDSTEGFTDLRFLGQACHGLVIPDSAPAVGPWDSISATGGSGRRVGLVQQAELIRATLEMDPTLSVPAILREAALLVGTEPEGPLLMQAGRLLDCLGLGGDASTHLQAQAQAQQGCRGDSEVARGDEAAEVAEAAEAAEAEAAEGAMPVPSPCGPLHGLASESSAHLFASVCTSAPDEEEQAEEEKAEQLLMAAAHRCISLLGRHQPPPPPPPPPPQQPPPQQPQQQQPPPQPSPPQQQQPQPPQPQPSPPQPPQPQPPQPQCPTTPLVNGGSLRSASGTLLAVGTVLRMGHERGRVERFDEAGGWYDVQLEGGSTLRIKPAAAAATHSRPVCSGLS